MENIRSKTPYSGDYLFDDENKEETKFEQHELDSYESEKKLSKIKDWWYETRIAHSENRQEMAIDDDYVNGLQWFEEDAEELRNRHQQPLVFNEIKPAVEWVIGTQKRTKIDWKIAARSEDDLELAEVKTKLLKYISDVNKAEFKKSLAFQSAISSGIGWLEVGIRADSEDELVFIRNESWRNIWLDHTSREVDISDARYLFRSKVVDLDIAEMMFPDRAMQLKSATEALDRLPYITEDDFYDSQLYRRTDDAIAVNVGDAIGSTVGRREVVRLIECWYKEPSKVQLIRGGRFSGKELDSNNAEMNQEINDGYASLFDAVRMKIRVCVFIDGGCLLQDMPSPYLHNRFPFVPVFAYRRSRDNQYYGIVRNARDPQNDLNKRRSKALFLLSVNRTIMDKGAVDDLDEYEEESARPDAIIEKNQGKQLEIETNIQLAEEHIMLANQNSEYIRQSSGVTGENMGLETNATSGKAILARQNQGTVVTATLFDNLRLSSQLSGEITLSLIEQFYSDSKILRVTGERGEQEFIHLNELDNESGRLLNDITKHQADFIVSEQDFRESLRVAVFEQMMDMMSKMDSTTAMSLLDLVFEYADVPGKDEIVRRIRKINGQSDPNDPQSKQKQQQLDDQAAQQQQQQSEIALKEAMVKIRAIEAKAMRDESMSHEQRVNAMVKAIDSAVQAMAVGSDVVQSAQDILEGASMSNQSIN